MSVLQKGKKVKNEGKKRKEMKIKEKGCFLKNCGGHFSGKGGLGMTQ